MLIGISPNLKCVWSLEVDIDKNVNVVICGTENILKTNKINALIIIFSFLQFLDDKYEIHLSHPQTSTMTLGKSSKNSVLKLI